jgi:hypothetical protein
MEGTVFTANNINISTTLHHAIRFGETSDVLVPQVTLREVHA